MKKLTIHVAVALLTLATQASFAKDSFTLSSSDIKAGSRIDMKHVFKGFGCEGGNLSPALAWSGGPLAPKAMRLWCMTPMHQQVVQAGGTGWLTTFRQMPKA